MSELPSNQEEHTHISTSLEVEQIEEGLYRSVRLFKPPQSRGVFGGQVISQACVSATNCVDSAFALHSLHCYFLASANPQIPILYHVDRLRTGRSYITCSVKAVQKGTTVFMMLCSFQKPEPWQPSHAWPIPKVPSPDECESEEVKYQRFAGMADEERIRDIFISRAEERRRSPIEIRPASIPRSGEAGVYMFWMRAKALEKYDASYQKCILGYISDLNFIPVAARVLGLVRYSKGPNALSMTSSIDHSISFYDNDFNCGEWLLYVISCPRTGSGRGVVHGRMYTESGRLIAVMSQEGVVRADRRPSNMQAKL